jgi:hypothetical protein
MNDGRVLWLADGVIEKTHPKNWARALGLANELVTVIGNPELDHVVVDPVIALHKLAPKLDSQQTEGGPYTAVIDLSGWLGRALQPVFPVAEVYSSFHLSRLSDPIGIGLGFAGHAITITPEELDRERARMNLSNVLILDDTGFGGSTSKFVTDVWGLSEENATHAFLIANTGELRKKDGSYIGPGVVESIEGRGGKVLYGEEMQRPRDTMWHLRDLYDHHDVEFSLSGALQLRDRAFTEEGRRHWEGLQQPPIDDIPGLHVGSRFLDRDGSTILRGPILWAAEGVQDFQSSVDIGAARRREGEVSQLLRGLAAISNENRMLPDITNALRAEVIGARGGLGLPTRRTRGERL